MATGFHIRRATAADAAGCARVCLQTGRYGEDGSADFPGDPDALSRIYTTPYLLLEQALSLVLVDGAGDIAGYCLAALDTPAFFQRYDRELRPGLLAQVPGAALASPSAREASIHRLYAQPDYALPPGLLEQGYRAHCHIDLLPVARRAGHGRALMTLQLAQLARLGAAGVHLNMAASNTGAAAFYAALGFAQFSRAGGEGEGATLFLARRLSPPPARGPSPYPGLRTNVASYLEGAGAALACGDTCLGPHWVAVTMPDPWRAARDRLGGEPPLAVVMVDSMQEAALEAVLAALPPAATVVAGIGGGQAVDAAKYLSWRRGLRLVTIPTALTVDAFVTPPAGVRMGEGHAVAYLGSATPDPLVIDFDLIRTAPRWLNVAGVGDILSCHTALEDWRRAHARGSSCAPLHPYSPADAAAARAVLEDTLHAAGEISACSDAGLRALVHGYMRINALCLPAGHPRCEEGSEHLLLYVLEARLKRPFIHGHIVGLGIHLMARLQGNDWEGITQRMRAMGLRMDPLDMGLTREDVRGALLALPAFLAARPDLYWTAAHEEGALGEAWVDEVLRVGGELKFA